MSATDFQGGTWNMKMGRDPATAAASAVGIAKVHDLDWLCLQEAAGYQHALRVAAVGGFDLVEFAHAVPGADSGTAILVRAGLEHGPGHQVKVTTTSWFRNGGARVGPKYVTTVRVAGLQVVSVHAVVGDHWTGGMLVGPIRRRLSYRQLARSLVRFAKAHPGPLVIGGDWNADKGTHGRYSPAWIATKAGLQLVAPRLATHGDREVIDYFLVRGGDHLARRIARFDSDHHAVLLDSALP